MHGSKILAASVFSVPPRHQSSQHTVHGYRLAIPGRRHMQSAPDQHQNTVDPLRGRNSDRQSSQQRKATDDPGNWSATE